MYYVIGGQYCWFYYGKFETLHAAKIKATSKREYWDNWQGWHTPLIYKENDVELVTGLYGEIYVPKMGAEPVAVHDGKHWTVKGE